MRLQRELDGGGSGGGQMAKAFELGGEPGGGSQTDKPPNRQRGLVQPTDYSAAAPNWRNGRRRRGRRGPGLACLAYKTDKHFDGLRLVRATSHIPPLTGTLTLTLTRPSRPRPRTRRQASTPWFGLCQALAACTSASQQSQPVCSIMHSASCRLVQLCGH